MSAVLSHVRLARPRLAVRGLFAALADLDRASRPRPLAQLDDHILRDIGIGRAEIDEELRRRLSDQPSG